MTSESIPVCAISNLLLPFVQYWSSELTFVADFSGSPVMLMNCDRVDFWEGVRGGMLLGSLACPLQVR